MKSKFIGVDFDNTVVNRFEEEIPWSIRTILDLMNEGHKIILYTARGGERLIEAIEYLEVRGVELYGVNENKSQKYWSDSGKVFCHMYIDDLALGCPLDDDGCVDWERVRDELFDLGYL